MHCEGYNNFEDTSSAITSILVYLTMHLKYVMLSSGSAWLLGGSGMVVNSLDFYPALLKSLGCFLTSGAYFLCNRKVVTVNL